MGRHVGNEFQCKKCYIMSIRKKTSKFYSLNNHILEEVQDNPYLGLQISSDMKWSTHINKVARKAQSTLGFLRRNLRHCTENCRKTAYIAMVRSVMEYGSTIWDPYQKGDIIKLERIQRKAIRFIKHDYRTREEGCINKMAAELGLPTLENRRKCLRLVLLYKVVEGLVPALPPDQFITKQRPRRTIKPITFENCNTTNILDRQVCNNSKNLIVIRGNTQQYNSSFFIQSIVDWNHLDEEAVSAKSVEAFKTALEGLSKYD